MDKPKATRISISKVRTGCLTCKKRHVKCDEAKPKCGNCARSDRNCTYEAAKPRGPPRSGSKPLQLRWTRPDPRLVLAPVRTQLQLNTDASDFGDPLSVLYFDEFVALMRGPWVAAGSHSDSWTVALPQLARANSPLRHAAIGIGAMSKWYSESGQDAICGVQVPTGPARDGDAHYFRAVAHYCESLRLHSKQSSMVEALYLSVLSLFFEVLRGHTRAALDHVNHGLAILVKLVTEDADEGVIANLAPNPRPIMAFVGDLFTHVIPQARSILRGGITDEPNLPHFSRCLQASGHTPETFMVLLSQESRSSSTLSCQIPDVFASLDEFEECWVAMRRRQTELGPLLMAAIRDSQIMDAHDQESVTRFWEVLMVDERIRDFVGNSVTQMQAIHDAFTPLFEHTMTLGTDSPEYLRAIHLRLQELGVYFFEDPSKYHNLEILQAQTPRFREYLLLVDLALRIARGNMGSLAQHLSLQCDLTLHLFLVTLFCRDALVREQAMWLLRDYPGRDGLWSTHALLTLALKNKEVERLNTVDGTPQEQWSRLWRREYLFENCGQRVVFCYLRRNDDESGWGLVEDVADVDKDPQKVVWKQRPLTNDGRLLMMNVITNG
jgi:hypothetical protein